MSTRYKQKTFKDFWHRLSQFNNQIAFIEVAENGSVPDLPDTRHTYQDFISDVLILQKRLIGDIGQRILLGELSPYHWLVAFWAITLKRMVAVPLDVRLGQEFVAKVVRSYQPLMLITDQTNLDFGGLEVPIVNFQKLILASPRSENELYANGEPQPDDVAEIVFTSGTWAEPKGVCLSHYNLLANVQQLHEYYSIPARINRSLLILPLSHSYAQMVGVFYQLWAGKTIVLQSSIDSESIKASIQKYQIQGIPTVPKMLITMERNILRYVPKRYQASFSTIIMLARFLPLRLRRRLFTKIHAQIGHHLEVFTVGGASLPLKTDRFFRGLGYHIYLGYGLSECAPVSSIALDERHGKGYLGNLLPEIMVRTGSVGTLEVKGPNVFDRYYEEPKLSKQTTYFNTGDVVKFDAKRRLFWHGRIKNLLVFPNGDKVFAEDLEQIISQKLGIVNPYVIQLEAGNQDGGGRLYCVVEHQKVIDQIEQINKKQWQEILNKFPSNIASLKLIAIPSSEIPLSQTQKPRRYLLQQLIKLKET